MEDIWGDRARDLGSRGAQMREAFGMNPGEFSVGENRIWES
jgi:hypothetical protein